MNEKIENLRIKLLKQANLLQKKIRGPREKELTNQDMELRLRISAQEEYNNRREVKRNERLIEDLHQRFTRLDMYQMNIMSQKYYLGKTEEEIAQTYHTTQQRIHEHLQAILTTLRQN